jgi:hypothetical protein
MAIKQAPYSHCKRVVCDCGLSQWSYRFRDAERHRARAPRDSRAAGRGRLPSCENAQAVSFKTTRENRTLRAAKQAGHTCGVLGPCKGC